VKRRGWRAWPILCIGPAVLTAVMVVWAAEPKPDELLAQADKLFEEKNYKEAAAVYEKVAKAEPRPNKWRHAWERTIICNLRLGLFDAALDAADSYIARCKNTPYEARAERLAGNLYMLVPHWGTRAGGKFHRAQSLQGIHVQSYQYDKKRAIAHLERARDLYAHYDADPKLLALLPEEERKNWHNERIECLFDLAGACSRFGIYENQYHFWYSAWGERDEFLAQTAGEEDFDESHTYRQLTRKRPLGLRLDAEGKPIFPTAPKTYAPDLDDDQKILYLLRETRDLDQTPNRKYAGLSYYRQAMLARARFGMDRLNAYAGLYYEDGARPLADELKEFNPWELKDNEALVLAGGRIRRMALPPEWDVLGLLRTVVGDYRQCGIADEAQYAIALYHQSRQQYTTALEQYDKLKREFPQSTWKAHAEEQIARILEPQVHINQPGVQLPGQPASLQLSYRNMSRVWFVARQIDHAGLFQEIRNQPIDPDKGLPGFWELSNWHSYFTTYHDRSWMHRTAAKYVGKEVARWQQEVADDGSHRYAQATLATPLAEPGAYLVYAYLKEPPAADAEKTGKDAIVLGNSRAVFVISDLAIVEKKVRQGNLYYITEARSGNPIAGAQISVLEVWTTYDNRLRKQTWHKEMHELKTNEEGMAILESRGERGGNLHVLVKAEPNRLAWTGMSYRDRYYPSRMRDGLFAYCITDRPVYRPGQPVRFKVWLRQMVNGNPQNLPGRSAQVTIRDPRGHEIYKGSKTTDQFGGFDGEVTLSTEAALGMYHINIDERRTYAGGTSFRVEEYKKPEFEVTVEPGKTHAKLGEKVTAVIRAKYYFGGPVSDATVKYRVLREEYTHSYCFPGEWDWLYGPGYGWRWYDYSWFPWWGRVRPIWVGYGRNPVRELVQQGEAAIGHDGTLKVEIDTAPALRDHPDRDHCYTVQAEVRDASRRVISGEGAVKVTRQAFYAFVQPDGGYYRPGDEMLIRIRCLTPDNAPVKTEGVVTVSSIVFGGPDNARIEEKELHRWRAATDESGLLEVRMRYERSGQLKFKFEAPDQWGGTVEGYGLVWVCGRDFDGNLYRFNNLELITDKRTYKPGEVAHVMVNARHSNACVLFSDDVDNGRLLSWRLLRLPNRSIVVDVPITAQHRPNFFIEATTVSEARVHEQYCQVNVPPEEAVIKLTVQTDKPEYRPGEKAQVQLTALTLDGKPAHAQITLSVFDRSVLYIQPEITPPITKFFHGHLRHHATRMSTNLTEQFSTWGYVTRPFQHLHPFPGAWWGIWGPSVEDWRAISDKELAGLMQDRLRGEGAVEFAGTGGRRREFARAAAVGNGARALEAAAPMAPPAGEDKEDRKGAGAPEAAPAFAEAEVRQKFADTALWLTTLTTDANGTASITFDMPENLTTWKIGAWAMTQETRVGQADTAATTNKNLLVRLQAPRFFMEYDEVVISANVHNYLAREKTARVSLEVPAELLKMIGATPPTVDVKVPAGGEKRVDWRVKVLKEGQARLTVQALTDEESDAMQMAFPVLVHGMTKQVASTGSVRPDEEEKTITVELQVPEARRPELTRLEVQYSPSLVGAMLDALPYCLWYPYGSTDQTMSRFLPAVLTLKTIQNMGIDLEDIRKIRGRLEEVRRVERGQRISIYSHIDNPVFDSGELLRIIQESLARIAKMQKGDGGWGWWLADESSPYLTSYVLYALCTAQQCDVKVDDNMIQRGIQFLKNWEEGQMRDKHWSVNETHAYVLYVLSLKSLRPAIKPEKDDQRPGDLVDRLYEGRDKLGLYGKALLAMALANLKNTERGLVVLRNIMQYKEENPETEVAWFRTPTAGWWYWWNNDIETNAQILRAIVKLDPKSEVAPRLVKWLLNNRRNGYYWRATMDTTMCVAALSEFVAASGEGQPDYTLTLDFDNGAVTKTVRINRDNFFTYDSRFVMEGAALSGGKHILRITKRGRGALYFNTYLRYFTKEEHITAAGHELKVERTCYKLAQIPYEVEVETATGDKIKEKRLRYERIPIRHGDTVQSSDLIQVELRVHSDNDYTYLCFEDMKAAGCEPVDVRSGGKGQEGFWSNMELRDTKVAFFVSSLSRGEHLLRYRVRAEIPGLFHALPTTLYGVYVPELRANSEEIVIRIRD